MRRAKAAHEAQLSSLQKQAASELEQQRDQSSQVQQTSESQRRAQAEEEAAPLGTEPAAPGCPVPLEDSPPSFPAAPSNAVSQQLLVAASIKAEAETTWCHICRNDAHIWCVDCSNDAYCAQCWRETHAQSWTDVALRKHRTVPCRAARLAAALPAAPA